ncbi:MAG: U32 family peptidase [Lactimicrobium sp.]|uniref:peptidase U32 family protein n=1 Tax=Lactimicrobium sp. TaxID=2563780 RepID=UPI002F3548F3
MTVDIIMRKPSGKLKKPELLAPAGDLSRARTAILYGADAVYLGGMNFSLRSRASNFTMDDIKAACDFAHAHHARIHVTVNVIPHGEDFIGLKEYVQALEDAGVDAAIVASPSIMKLIKENTTHIEVHGSTQMSITNVRAAKFLHETLGIDRVVLGRECTMKEVEEITANCPIETEAFIHGGMCVNYSGRCTLSNRMTLRDANRGGCAQSCRWQYRLFENDRQINDENSWFTMGSRDLMAGRWIKDLMKAGVSSLKIEGRMKTEYYVANVVSGYRRMIDDLYEHDGNISDEKLEAHIAQIMRGENREVCDGFYGGIASQDSIIYHENSNNHVNHDFLGTIMRYDRDTHTAWMQVRNAFDNHEKAEVLSPGREIRNITLSSIQNDQDEYLDTVRKPMSIIHFASEDELAAGDIIRKAADDDTD